MVKISLVKAALLSGVPICACHQPYPAVHLQHPTLALYLIKSCEGIVGCLETFIQLVIYILDIRKYMCDAAKFSTI